MKILDWASLFICHILNFNGLRSAEMRRKSCLGISSRYLMPLKGPDAHRETDSKRERAGGEANWKG